MNYVLRIFYNNEITDITLSGIKEYTIGSGNKDSFIITDCELKHGHFKIKNKKGKFLIVCSGDVFLGNTKIKNKEAEPNDTYVLNKSKKVAVSVMEDMDSRTETIELVNVNEVLIGRDSACNIVLNNKRVSNNHAKIYKNGADYHISDIGSTNGTYVNNKIIRDVVLADGDIITIGKYSILFNEKKLEISQIKNDVILNVLNKTMRDPNAYPFFKRSPRMNLEVAQEQIEIAAPPYKMDKPEINWFSVMLSPIIMIAVAVLSMMLTNGGLTSLLFILPITVVTIITTITTYRSQVKKHRNNLQTRIDKYAEYLKHTEEELGKKYTQQLNANKATHPDTAECINIAKNIERRLWERVPIENDFLTTRLGSGNIPFLCDIAVPKRGIELEVDHLASEPEKIKAKFESLKNVAVTLPIFTASTIGVIGERTPMLNVVRNMLAQLATHHSYNELQIIILVDESEREDWTGLRWLPHICGENQFRYIAIGASESVDILRSFETQLKERIEKLKSDKFRNQKLMLPYYLFVIGNKSLVENQTIMDYLTRNDPQLGVGSLFMFDNISYLPQECKWFLDCKEKKSILYSKENPYDKQEFVIDKMEKVDYEKFARYMAPIREQSLTTATVLPLNITFMQGYGIKSPNEIDIIKRWNSGVPYESLSVPIGVKANGETFNFDVHEKAHGPHGLVAGTTGSGKSEILQTWILSMCLNFNPQDVSFVLIDFKGTGLAGALMELPHIAGIISNVDSGNIQRNLISLESEIHRREIVLKEASNSSIQFKNVDQYQKAYKEGKVDKPLSHLIIVIDEFAELKAQHPDFMAALVRAARVGRSLGIHLVLATQKPSGVVDDQIWSNSRFKWCLKVADESDSTEMIKRSDAASIKNPGRAYIMIGHNELFELIQSYWSGALYSEENVNAVAEIPISFVSLNGTRTKSFSSTLHSLEKHGEEEILVISKYIVESHKKTELAVAQKLWENELLKRVYLEDICCEKLEDTVLAAKIGIVDNPYTQSQYPLVIDIGNEGHLAIYGAPSTGKTTLLQTIVFSLAKNYTPNEVNVYIMDFGGWSMSALKGLPHIGGIANDNEEEKVLNLARMLLAILDDRKNKFASISANNIQAYRRATGEQMPCITLIVDNFAPVLTIYPDLDAFFITMAREGGSYGIYLILSATTVNSINYRISQNFKQAISLQMIDKTEYIDIVGRIEGIEPSKVAGRGLVRGKPPLEFQTALSVKADNDADYINLLKSECNEISKSWVGALPLQIPIMPTIVTSDHIKNVPNEFIALGLTSEIEPVLFNLENEYAIISGTDVSGKTTLLRQFAAIEGKDNNAQIYWLGIMGTKPIKEGVRIICDSIEMESVIQEIYTEVEKRYNSGNSEYPIVVLIDDLGAFCKSVSTETKEKIDEMMRMFKNCGFYLYATGNCRDIIELYNDSEPMIPTLVGANSSIVLGGSFSEHDIFDTNLGYSDRDIELPSFYGYFNVKGKTTKFKAICN